MRHPWVTERASGQTPHPFAIYPDWQTSLLDWCEYIRGYYVDGQNPDGKRMATVAEILPVYAPSFENDTQLYIRQVWRWVADWQEADTMTAGFLYEGVGLLPSAFTSYVDSYDFGSVPPDFVVLHHTAIPDTADAPIDRNPLNDWQGTYEQRKGRLDGIMRYYRDQLHWDRGPHLFIDETYIWVMTPMYYEGIHAGYGNSYNRVGRWGYSIGIEVVGYYDKVSWPDAVARNVAHAVCVLKQRLGTFSLKYQKWGGGISMHRDYTDQKTCPGLQITPEYFLSIFRAYWQQHFAGATPEPDCAQVYRVIDHIGNGPFPWNKAVIRTGPTTQSAFAAHLGDDPNSIHRWWLEPGEVFQVRGVVADATGGRGRWLWLGGERDQWGFVHESLAERD
jgi:hypothetical protein